MNYFYLLLPKVLAFRGGLGRRDSKSSVRAVVMAALGICFWAGAFALFYRSLVYFRSTELIGDLLAYRLLELVFMTFFSVLVFSNVITALSTFYLSNELQLVLASPAEKDRVYISKYIETAALSSWMVAIFGLPVFLSYGLVYHSGPLFYAASVAVLGLFILIPAPLGMMLAMALVRVFPAKRTKDILFFLTILMVVGLYFLVRFIQPERLVNPENFEYVTSYVASLKAPSKPYMPVYWAAQALWPLISGRGEAGWLWLIMLASTAAALFVICGWVFAAIYESGYSRAQEGGRYRTYGLFPSGALLDRLAGPLRSPLKALIVKDVKNFMRDTSQWSQLFLLGALVVVYIYNFKALPLKSFPFATFFLENFISFLNLGLAGFVIAAVAVRFVFPAVSLERESFWIMRASPVGMKRFLWAKFWTAWIPLFILAEALVVLSNHFLESSAFMTGLSAVAIFFITFGVTGLGIGLGAIFPKFKYENAAQISAGYGGIVYMLLAVGFIGAVVTLLGWPVYLFLTARYRGHVLHGGEAAFSVLCVTAALLINIAACIIPMRRGLKCLEEMEG